MARVPIKQTQVFTQPTRLPQQTGTNASLRAFGGIQAAALGQTAQAVEKGAFQLAKFGRKLQVEDNEREAKQLDIDFENQKRLILNGDGTTVNPGFYSLKGQAAIDAASSIQEELQDIRNSMSGSASNARVQDMFDVSSGLKLNADLEQFGNHVIKQRNVADLRVSAARTLTAIEAARRNPNSGPILAQSQAVIFAENEKESAINGWSETVEAFQLKEKFTNLYQEVVTGQIKNQDYLGAIETLEAHRGEMFPAIVDDLAEKIRSNKLLGDTQRITDEYELSGSSLVDNLKRAKKEIEDPALRNGVEDELNARAQRKRKAELNEIADAVSTFSQALNVTDPNESPPSLSQLQLDNPERWATIAKDPSAVKALRAQDLLNRKGAVYPDISDQATLKLLDSQTPEEKANNNMVLLQSQLTQERYEREVREHRAAQKAVRGDAESNTAFATVKRVIRDIAPPSMRFSQKRQSSASKDRENFIVNKGQTFANDFFDAEGRFPNEREITDYISRFFIPLTNDKGVRAGVSNFFGVDVREEFTSLFDALENLTPKELEEVVVDIDDISELHRGVIVDKFVEAGFQKKNVTDDLIEEFMGAFIAGQTKRLQRILNPENQRSDAGFDFSIIGTAQASDTGFEFATKKNALGIGTPIPGGVSVELPQGQQKSVEQKKVTDDVLFSLITQESGGDPNAFNPGSQAQGVAQILPDVAEDPGFGVTPISKQDRRDPKKAIQFAREYLGAMVDKFGSLQDGLYAYNWGPGNVQKWIDAGRPADKLPTETRNYASDILQRLKDGVPSGSLEGVLNLKPTVTNKPKRRPK